MEGHYLVMKFKSSSDQYFSFTSITIGAGIKQGTLVTYLHLKDGVCRCVFGFVIGIRIVAK